MNLTANGSGCIGFSQTPTRTPTPTPTLPPAGGVTLYEHTYYGGRSETFTSDDPDLNDDWIGNDTISSLIVSSGYIATLYEHTYYMGRSETFTGPINDLDLSDNWIGNDTVSSLKVSRGPSSYTNSYLSNYSLERGILQQRDREWKSSLGKK